MKEKLVSIVIPVFNEEESLPELFERLSIVIKELRYKFEIIFVNDGSSDGTWEKIQVISRTNDMVKGINFSRNFGHPSALQAGLENAHGDAVIMMDGDLQHPPELLPALLEKWEEGFLVVSTIRDHTEGIGLMKKLTSRLFYRLLNALSHLEINEGEADFRLVDRLVVDKVNELSERPKFYRGLFHWLGFRATYIHFSADSRKFGQSSFSTSKMISLARMGLTSFSMKPLEVIIGAGLLLFTVSLVSLLVVLYVKFGVDYGFFSGSFILVILIMMITSLLIIVEGIIAIYLVDIFKASLGRPSYIISSSIGLSNRKE